MPRAIERTAGLPLRTAHGLVKHQSCLRGEVVRAALTALRIYFRNILRRNMPSIPMPELNREIETGSGTDVATMSVLSAVNG